jgi:DMSO/TMAO reductase YedYZ heme-binding membrane subunit
MCKILIIAYNNFYVTLVTNHIDIIQYQMKYMTNTYSLICCPKLIFVVSSCWSFVTRPVDKYLRSQSQWNPHTLFLCFCWKYICNPSPRGKIWDVCCKRDSVLGFWASNLGSLHLYLWNTKKFCKALVGGPKGGLVAASWIFGNIHFSSNFVYI